jgi:L-aminopeptidase/D-esterase-like protein
MTAPRPRNLITDVPGILVGNAHDADLLSGVTVILPQADMVAGVDVRGGAPGSRETEALDPTCLVDRVHAIVLAGGSVFGLDAASGATQWLAERRRGFTFRDQPQVCPVVPAAVLFDLTNGGDKNWGAVPPYRALGLAACDAADGEFALGNAGAGMGALAGSYKGGLGSASITWDGHTVGALAAVNAFGSPVVPGTDVLWAAPYEIDGEFGGAGEVSFTLDARSRSLKEGTKADVGSEPAAGRNTTLGVVATDLALTPAAAKRVAMMAADGMARALRPVHTPFDGDIVFAISSAPPGAGEPQPAALAELGANAADVMARAVARGVFEAATTGGWQSFRDRHNR